MFQYIQLQAISSISSCTIDRHTAPSNNIAHSNTKSNTKSNTESNTESNKAEATPLIGSVSISHAKAQSAAAFLKGFLYAFAPLRQK